MKQMFSAEQMAEDQMTLLPTGKFINVSGTSTKLSIIYPHDAMLPLQFTGLKDKNGREIYEGDIIQNKSLSMKGEIKMGYHETSLGKHYGWFIHRYMKIGKDKATSWESPHWEVIGNIYENPELIN